MGAHGSKNLVIALALAGAAALVVTRRVLPYLGDHASYTDGEEIWTTTRGEGLRYAVWKPAQPLGGAVNTPAHETRPGLSPDGRWLVFAVGEAGQNAELYLARMVAGQPTDARPLAAVNTDSDELAPAFGRDALYFASNRPGGAGGFDLYTAGWDGEVLGPVQRLADSVNTAADELDPAPHGGAPGVDLGGAGELYFASNRGGAGRGDFDLFAAWFDDQEGRVVVEGLAALNSAGEEREPGLTADGRTLFYASDRDAAGDFDLWKSVHEHAAWLAPRRLEGLSTSASERGPQPSADGFALFFTRAADGLAPDLLRARSAELFRLPAQALGWADLALLAALLVLALLAWLSKRWEQLDVLYKCFLVSLLVHLLLMWLLRGVHPESELQAPTPGRAATFKVRVLRDSSELSARGERGGLLEPDREAVALAPAPARLAAAQSLAQAPAPERVSLARSPAPLPAVPVVVAANLEPGAATLERPALRLADAGPSLPLRAAPAPRLEIAQASGAEASVSPTDAPLGAAPARSRLAPSAASLPAAPGPVRVARREAASAPAAPAFQPADSRVAGAGSQGSSGSSSGLRGPQLEAPEQIAVARASGGPAAQLELPTPAVLAAPSRGSSGSSGSSGSAAPAAPLRTRVAREDVPDSTPAAPLPRALPLEVERPAPQVALPEAPPRPQETPYRSRFGSEKQVALETFGGGADTERAVLEGLSYLASRQRAAGHWADARDRDSKYHDVRVGNTGLCLLAFLAAGHTPDSGTQFSGTTRRAVDYLLSTQLRRNGHFGDTASYGHGIATYALAECYALTRDEHLRVPLERAVARILSKQFPADYRGEARLVGGWGYYYGDGSTYDAWPRVSITSWQVMALEAARLGGLEVDEEVLLAAGRFLAGSWDGRLGALRYSHDPRRLNSGYATLPGSTPAGLFALSLLGQDLSHERFRAPREYVLQRAPRDWRYRGDDAFVQRAAGNVYFLYYGSLAMLRAGGADWQRWNVALKETLLPSQEEDGSWRPLGVYARYAGDTPEDSIFTTAMCVLSLEVYYRYFTPLLERE